LQLRTLSDDLLHAAFHLHRGRADFLGDDDQRGTLLVADRALGQHRRGAAAQAAEPLDQKRQAADRRGHQVVGLRLRIEGQAVGVRQQRLEVQQLADQRGVRLVALCLRPALYVPLDLVPAATDVLPFAHAALVVGQHTVQLRRRAIDIGLQRASAIGHAQVTAQQHRRHAAVLLGQFHQFG